jgi:hypothetical protein
MSDELEVIAESAKAAQEIAKLGGKVVDAAQNAAPFINRVLGGPIEDATGLLIADPLRAVRILTQDWLARQVTKKLRARNLRDEQLKAVPPNIAIPLLEAAQDETRDELREVWARLLANAMDPNRSSRVRLEFIETLRQFNPLDAILLNELVAVPSMSPNSRDFLVARLGVSRDEIIVSSQHLIKLGCIDVSITDKGNYGVLPYGKILLHACEGP